MSKQIQAMMLSEKLKMQLKQCNLPQRKVPQLSKSAPQPYCKRENGNYSPKREQVIELVNILHNIVKELLTLWLADQIKEITDTNKYVAEEAMEIIKTR